MHKEDADRAVRRWGPMVYRLAFARMGNRFDADEVFQEVFLRYIKNRKPFADEQHERAWLLKVTVNCAKKIQQSPWRRRALPLDGEMACWPEDKPDLAGEMQNLPPKYREVIHLFYYEDLPVAQIARLLRRKESTVRTQLSRGRALLRGRIKELEQC